MRTASGWSLAAGAGSVVDGRGPRAGVPGVGGEVADGVAELAVDRPAEAVRDAGAGPAGDRGDPGQPGQRFRVGEAGPAVADLGEQPGGAHGSGPGQRGKDVPVGVGGQLPGDLGFQGLDLGGQRGQRGGQGRGDACLGGAVGPGGAGRGGLQPSVQLAGRGRAPACRDGRQPCADRLLIQSRGGVLAAEPGQEGQADRAVQVVEQP
jgi:translation initiation factor IF-2